MVSKFIWTNGTREDGLFIESVDVNVDIVDGAEFFATAHTQAHRIVRPDSDFLFIYCPCCGNPFRDRDHAMTVADQMFPEYIGRVCH